MIPKILPMTLMVVAFTTISPMDDGNEYNNEKKRDIDQILDNNVGSEEKNKDLKRSMSDDDWYNGFELLDNASEENENETEFITTYLKKIYNDNDIEYMALHAIIDDYPKIIQAIKDYKVPLLTEILNGDVQGVKNALKNRITVHGYHVHIALERNNEQIVALVVQAASQKVLKEYEYDDLNFIEYCLESHFLDSYINMLIVHGCPIRYREMLVLMILGRDEYFDLFLLNIIDINEKPKGLFNKSLLWYAIAKERFDWIVKMLEKGAKVTVVDIADNYRFGIKDDFKIDTAGDKIVEYAFNDISHKIAELFKKVISNQVNNNGLDQALKDKFLTYLVEKKSSAKDIERILKKGADPMLVIKRIDIDGNLELSDLSLYCANSSDYNEEERGVILFLLWCYSKNCLCLLYDGSLHENSSNSVKEVARCAIIAQVLKVFPELVHNTAGEEAVHYLKKRLSFKKNNELATLLYNNVTGDSLEKYENHSMTVNDLMGNKPLEEMQHVFKKYDLYALSYFVNNPLMFKFFVAKLSFPCIYRTMATQEKEEYQKRMQEKLEEHKQTHKHDIGTLSDFLDGSTIRKKFNNNKFADLYFETQE